MEKINLTEFTENTLKLAYANFNLKDEYTYKEFIDNYLGTINTDFLDNDDLSVYMDKASVNSFKDWIYDNKEIFAKYNFKSCTSIQEVCWTIEDIVTESLTWENLKKYSPTLYNYYLQLVYVEPKIENLI